MRRRSRSPLVILRIRAVGTTKLQNHRHSTRRVVQSPVVSDIADGPARARQHPVRDSAGARQLDQGDVTANRIGPTTEVFVDALLLFSFGLFAEMVARSLISKSRASNASCSMPTFHDSQMRTEVERSMRPASAIFKQTI